MTAIFLVSDCQHSSQSNFDPSTWHKLREGNHILGQGSKTPGLAGHRESYAVRRPGPRHSRWVKPILMFMMTNLTLYLCSKSSTIYWATIENSCFRTTLGLVAHLGRSDFHPVLPHQYNIRKCILEHSCGVLFQYQDWRNSE